MAGMPRRSPVQNLPISCVKLIAGLTNLVLSILAKAGMPRRSTFCNLPLSCEKLVDGLANWHLSILAKAGAMQSSIKSEMRSSISNAVQGLTQYSLNAYQALLMKLSLTTNPTFVIRLRIGFVKLGDREGF